jgi:hypothetical protein
MSGATTTKNNLKNIARNPPTTTHLKIALKNKTDKWMVQTPPKTTSKTVPEIHQQKHIGKPHWKTTPKNEWRKHHQKQCQKLYPKSTNKNLFKNRTETTHRKISGTSTTETNSKTLPEIHQQKHIENRIEK